MREQEKMNNAFEKYALEENHEFYVKCSEIEGEGYCPVSYTHLSWN